ncbi:hypothetical protein ASPBRDRAFT_79428 [Aspergillus brasiliensis CBS 101740]|uniref:Uncharacterized protein n=1 Tax=Aspergillus brasiliensis (strain CBS 101740 / IMI 381727 / IBT 21946) TaxID=767769 RepID=A0A1L9U3B8_ASPBC|nr:hypothetical protein ASPBRDRAFT_79428 [Aspergillus brasiliensis CBS 101740]
MVLKEKVNSIKARLCCRVAPEGDKVDVTNKRDAQQSSPSTAKPTVNDDTVQPPPYSESLKTSTSSYTVSYNGDQCFGSCCRGTGYRW